MIKSLTNRFLETMNKVKELRFNYFQLLAFYNYDKSLVSLLFQSFSEQFPQTKTNLLKYYKNNDQKGLSKSLESLRSFALNFQCSELVEEIIRQEKLLILGEQVVEIKLYSILSKSQKLIDMISVHQKQAA